MLIMSYMGDQVWLMTSRQTDPDLVPLEIALLIKRQSVQLVDVRVKDPIDEANTRALVRVLVRKLDVDFPETASEWSWAG